MARRNRVWIIAVSAVLAVCHARAAFAFGPLAHRIAGLLAEPELCSAARTEVAALGGAPKNEMGVAPFAHTSPIYLELAGRKIFQADAARALVADMEAAEKAIGAKAKFDRDAQREEVLKIYRDGIALLRKRLNE